MSSSGEQPTNFDSSDDEQESFTAHKAKKTLKIESDSDIDEKPVVDRPEQESSDSEKSELGDSGFQKSLTKKKRKIKRALSNSSDEESESESDSGSKEGFAPSGRDSNASNRSTPQKKSSHINRSGILDSSDLDQDSDTDIRLRNQNQDSDREDGSGSDESNVDDCESNQTSNAKGRKKSKSEFRQSRKAKDSAMKEIQSESQRMLRESKVGLPYHKPRQRTLDEFLNRKKNAPDMKILDIKKLPNLVVNTEDVIAAEKLLEERERLAVEFFKTDEEKEEADVSSYHQHDNVIHDAERNGTVEVIRDTQDTILLQDSENLESFDFQRIQSEDLDSIKINDECRMSTFDPESAIGSENIINDNETALEQPEPYDTKVAPYDEEDTLKLFLEPDTETMDLLDSKTNPKNESLTSTAIAALKSTLAKQPKVGLNRNASEIILDEIVIVGEEKVGLETLKDRFVKHVSARSKQIAFRKTAAEVVSIVKKETGPDGVVRICQEKIILGADGVDASHSKINFDLVKQAQQSEKPGAQQEALKQTLWERIRDEKKKERELRESTRKIDDEEGDADSNESFEDDPLDGVDEDELEEEEEELEETDEDEDEEEEEEFESNTQGRNRIKCAFLDDEAEEENDECDNGPTKGPKIVSSVPNFNNEDSSSLMNISQGLSPLNVKSQVESNLSESISGARKKLGFESLFDKTDPNHENFDDIVGLCSGQFVTQNPEENLMSQSQSYRGGSQTPDTVVLTNSLTQTQSILSYFKTQTKEVSQGVSEPPSSENTNDYLAHPIDNSEVENDSVRGFLDSTDSEGENKFELAKEKPKTYRKKMIKRKVVISDDESNSEMDEKAHDETDEDSEETSQQKREIIYDSEENEIDEEERSEKFNGFLSKKGRIRGEFLENEAELSGSEVDSEDEDESGLDRLMLEEGDYDDVDEEALRDEVGRIHQRQLLDEDQREIRLFQEAFLEDGELHSDNARQRKFKWKNLDDSDADHTNKLTQFGEEEGEDDEAGAEESWRLQKVEREKWMEESLSKSSLDTSEANDEVTPSHDDSQFFNLASKVLKKIESKPNSQTNGKTINKVFKSPKAKLPLKTLSSNSRGSFLSRDVSTLDKIAEMTKNTSSTKSGSSAKSSRNFAFAILSPPKQSDPADIVHELGKEKRKKSTKNLLLPQTKKAKIDRSINENSNDTIFTSI